MTNAKELTETVNSSAQVATQVTRRTKVDEIVEAGRYNKVELKYRHWEAKPWMKGIISIAKRLPMFLQTPIIRGLQKYGTYQDWKVLSIVDNLLTNAGRDLLHNTGLQATGQPAGAQFVALSADAGNPVVGDTTLTAEITTPAGLARASAAYAHTASTNTSTLIKTFTNDGIAQVAGIRRSATFNASSAGTIGFSNTFTSVTLEVNDQLQVTWTITIG